MSKTQPETITLTLKGTADPQQMSRFLKWVASDVETLRKPDDVPWHVEHAYDPESEYVTTTAREKVCGKKEGLNV